MRGGFAISSLYLRALEEDRKFSRTRECSSLNLGVGRSSSERLGGRGRIVGLLKRFLLTKIFFSLLKCKFLASVVASTVVYGLFKHIFLNAFVKSKTDGTIVSSVLNYPESTNFPRFSVS